MDAETRDQVRTCVRYALDQARRAASACGWAEAVDAAERAVDGLESAEALLSETVSEGDDPLAAWLVVGTDHD